jgi:hypothetical protein
MLYAGGSFRLPQTSNHQPARSGIW